MPKVAEIVKATFIKSKTSSRASTSNVKQSLSGTHKGESQGHSSVGLAEGQSPDGEAKPVQGKRGRSSTLHHTAQWL